MEYILQMISSNWVLIALVLTLLFLYNHYTSTYDHFRNMGVPFLKPTIILGNIGPRLMLKISFHDFNIQVYRYFAGLPYGGKWHFIFIFLIYLFVFLKKTNIPGLRIV